MRPRRGPGDGLCCACVLSHGPSQPRPQRSPFAGLSACHNRLACGHELIPAAAPLPFDALQSFHIWTNEHWWKNVSHLPMLDATCMYHFLFRVRTRTEPRPPTPVLHTLQPPPPTPRNSSTPPLTQPRISTPPVRSNTSPNPLIPHLHPPSLHSSRRIAFSPPQASPSVEARTRELTTELFGAWPAMYHAWDWPSPAQKEVEGGQSLAHAMSTALRCLKRFVHMSNYQTAPVLLVSNNHRVRRCGGGPAAATAAGGCGPTRFLPIGPQARWPLTMPQDP
jgi:hypothetical protein